MTLPSAHQRLSPCAPGNQPRGRPQVEAATTSLQRSGMHALGLCRRLDLDVDGHLLGDFVDGREQVKLLLRS